uniref:Uncharacterized protein n=1 Tax=Cacopsylla melanoneura TaxID=428564 RepID=A0A8D9A6E1_9HEMI
MNKCSFNFSKSQPVLLRLPRWPSGLRRWSIRTRTNPLTKAGGRGIDTRSIRFFYCHMPGQGFTFFFPRYSYENPDIKPMNARHRFARSIPAEDKIFRYSLIRFFYCHMPAQCFTFFSTILL